MWKGGGRDVLSCNVFSRMESKVLVDEGVLGGRREDVLLLVVTVLRLVGGDVGKEFEVVGWGGRDGGTGDDIGRGVGDVEEGIILDVVKGRPDKLWRWGARRGSDGGRGTEGVNTWAGIVPGIEVRIEDFEDCGGSVGDVLLVNVIKGRPGSDGDLGEGGGGDDGGLGSVERHLLNN